MTSPIYLDYAATTPVDPRVAEAMSRYLTPDGVFGNPASDHVYGIAAAQAVEQARQQVAAMLNAEPGEIIWTSGATEANNLALKGAMQQYRKRGRHLITSKTEHRAVLDVCRQLQQDGYQVTYLDPEPDGRLAPGALAAALRDDTVLVSLMHVNNELGVVHDLATIGRLTRERGVLLHVDAAQGAGKLPLDLQVLNIDLLSLSAHKLYGPKGIGALYLRRQPRVRLVAQLQGGGQEQGLRAGTLPTHQIVGMGEAFRLARLEMTAEQERLRVLRDRLWQGVQALEGVMLNGHPSQCVAGILNLSFAGITSEALRAALGDIAVSTGSACSSASHEPSHVLKALGLEPLRARGAIRFSLGRFTTEAEIDQTLERLREAVQRLRALSPIWEGMIAGVGLPG